MPRAADTIADLGLPDEVLAALRAKLPTGAPEACWAWAGALNDGVPSFAPTVGGTRYRVPVRVAVHVMHCGPVPAHRFVLPSCGTRACLNPAHLQLGHAPKPDPDAGGRGHHKELQLRVAR